MATIRPFCAIRPRKGLEERIAALPYDVYSRKEAKEKVQNDEYSFLRIDRAETQFDDSQDMYADEVYKKAHDLLWDMVKKGDFVKEDKPCYYLYELVMNGRSQTGIVGCADVDDYQNNVIKKHENTRAEKELDRIRHVDALHAQTGPIFLAYRAVEELNLLVKRIQESVPLYDFTSEDGVTHRVWVIDQTSDIQTISKEFGQMNAIYIADGHHRCASAAKVSTMYRERKGTYDKSEEFNYFLSVLFPDEQLMIMDYNRVVKDLNGYSKEALLEKFSELGQVTLLGSEAATPSKKGEVTFFIEGNWYRLIFDAKYLSEDPVEGLDVSILQNNCLSPIFGIEDPKTDRRIDFVGGIRGLKELERRVNEDCSIAFAMYPTSISELFAVADANRLMPPKSTWFEPKLRSGLFIHDIKDNA